MNRCVLSCSTVAFDGHDLETAFRGVHDAGFQWVELAFIEGYVADFNEELFGEQNARSVRSRLAGSHLRCSGVSAHIDLGRHDSIDRMARRIDFCRAVEATRVVTNAAPLEREADFFRNMDRIVPLAEDAGVTVCLENPGDGVPNVINDGASAAAVASRLASPSVKINYDCGNTFSHFHTRFPAENDFAPVLGSLEQLHLKDVTVASDGHYEYPALGEGQIDFAAMANTLGDTESIAVLCLEIPLRLRRTAAAEPYRNDARLSPARIVEVIDASRRLVDKCFARILSKQHDH